MKLNPGTACGCCGSAPHNAWVDTKWCGACVAPGTITVTIKSGSCPGGATVATGIADPTDGIAKFNLPVGTYCASASTSSGGYLNDAANFAVTSTAEGSVIPISPLYPDQLTVSDLYTGKTVTVFPYGPGPPGADPPSASIYWGSVLHSYPATECCDAGSVTIWYGFACTAGGCDGPAVITQMQGSDVSTPDGGDQICPDDGGDNTNSTSYCLEGDQCYPLDMTFSPGGTVEGGGGAVAAVYGCASGVLVADDFICMAGGNTNMPDPCPVPSFTVTQ